MDNLKEVIKRCNFDRLVAFDIETTGTYRYYDDITLVQLGWFDKQNKYHGTAVEWDAMPVKAWANFFRALKREGVKLLAHNGKFDLLFVYEHTRVKLELCEDTMLLAHTLGADEKLGLKHLVHKYFHVDYDIDKETKTAVGGVTKELIEYGLKDVEYTYKLYLKLRKKLKGKQVKVYEHEKRACKAYFEVETYGIPVSDRRYEVREELVREAEAIKQEYLSEYPINWGSAKQVRELLYTPTDQDVYIKEPHYEVDGVRFKTMREAKKLSSEVVKRDGFVVGKGLGLKPIKETKSGEPSTDENSLVRLSSQCELLQHLIKWKKLTKLVSMIDGWEPFIVNGYMHPSFNLTTRTGRTSCKDPNIQQISQDKRIRGLIEAKPGYKIIECDLSQAELRVGAWFSGDKTMIDAYVSGSDLHQKTCDMLYPEGLSEDKGEAKRQRTKAKATNFSLIYGAIPQSLVTYAEGWGLEMSLEEAEEYHKKFFEAYPKLNDYYDKCIDFARRKGYIENVFGRVRYLRNISHTNWGLRTQAERQAINTPIQGMASDICISAMADVVFSEELDHSKFSVVGTVHDAILMEVKEEYAEELGAKVKAIMENPTILQGMNCPVPIVADVEINNSWGG